MKVSSSDPSGRTLGAREFLGDQHIQRDYELLGEQLQARDPNLAARTRLVDPLIAHYHLRLGEVSEAQRAFRRIVQDPNRNDTATSCFCQ
ncbi:hypothetical protein [Mesorhizobium sp. L-8-10]|uniref:hypothetical protein n=1 Tax=Mesorhizobium sp. L-8-10 TaxID=2744523 RepID=UPI000B02143C|nr:hypothetical protein [Mesorhizobium sp. L-8-10]